LNDPASGLGTNGAFDVNWFAGRSAIVTGAAHGIGRGIAELLELLGARVIAVDKDERALHQNLRGERYVHCHGDLASGDVEQLADEIWRRHRPIEMLVNNVGIDTPDRFFDVGEEEFDLVFGTNLRGPWFFTKRIARHLVEARMAGAILFVSSLHDTRIHGLPHYSASKAAVAMLVKELANELGPAGIRVNAVSPGNVRSNNNPLTREDEALADRVVPLGRVGEPVDVARMAAVLLNDDWSGYVTGANVPVDGGLGLYSWSVDEPADRSAGGLRDRLSRVRRRFGPGSG
jgi:NAD(P)-dependent dehydrogenase (short-subunit alcohol dehydrogenase family)